MLEIDQFNVGREMAKQGFNSWEIWGTARKLFFELRFPYLSFGSPAPRFSRTGEYTDVDLVMQEGVFAKYQAYLQYFKVPHSAHFMSLDNRISLLALPNRETPLVHVIKATDYFWNTWQYEATSWFDLARILHTSSDSLLQVPANMFELEVSHYYQIPYPAEFLVRAKKQPRLLSETVDRILWYPDLGDMYLYKEIIEYWKTNMTPEIARAIARRIPGQVLHTGYYSKLGCKMIGELKLFDLIMDTLPADQKDGKFNFWVELLRLNQLSKESVDMPFERDNNIRPTPEPIAQISLDNLLDPKHYPWQKRDLFRQMRQPI